MLPSVRDDLVHVFVNATADGWSLVIRLLQTGRRSAACICMWAAFRTEDDKEEEKMREWEGEKMGKWDYRMPWDLRISARSACFFAYSRSVEISVRLFSSAIDDRSNAGCIAVRRSQIMYPNMNM